MFPASLASTFLSDIRASNLLRPSTLPPPLSPPLPPPLAPPLSLPFFLSFPPGICFLSRNPARPYA